MLGIRLVNYPNNIALVEGNRRLLLMETMNYVRDMFKKYDWKLLERDNALKLFVIEADMDRGDGQALQRHLAFWREELVSPFREQDRQGATMLFDYLIGIDCYPISQGDYNDETFKFHVHFAYKQFGYLERRREKYHQHVYPRDK